MLMLIYYRILLILRLCGLQIWVKKNYKCMSNKKVYEKKNWNCCFVLLLLYLLSNSDFVVGVVLFNFRLLFSCSFKINLNWRFANINFEKTKF